MNHSWPPLTALRAFESAGRHLSFRKAATELHVTPAAISHQIKLLEDQVGVQLFRRLPRTIELTEAGRSFLPKLNEGFERLAQAVQTVRAYQKVGKLSVNAPPFFAAKWLMPRLSRFVAAFPDIDIRISASLRQVDTRRNALSSSIAAEAERVDDADIDIRFGTGVYPGYRVDKLFGLTFTPLCSPRLLEGQPLLRRPEDLRHYLLLHDDLPDISEGWPTWARWFRAAGVAGVESGRGPHLSYPTLALDAAIDGAGVVLGANELAAFDLAAKRLVAPFNLSIESEFPHSYYALTAESRADEPKVAAFREWLLSESRNRSPA